MPHNLDGRIDQKELISRVADEFNADVFVYVGFVFPPDDKRLINLIRDCKCHPNALLIVDTLGGSVDTAYRMARAFQRAYRTKVPDSQERGKFLVYVPELCKSAGTLFALAADKLIVSQVGELGPIDVQLRKDDEIGESMSGLTPHQALETLQIESGQHFSRFFRQLRFNQELGFSSKLSADIAAGLVVGLMGPVYAQLDPARLGEFERFTRISSEYGERLRTENVRDRTIGRLAASYPSHEFVIDRTETIELFEHVDDPLDILEQLGALVNSIRNAVMSSRESVILCLSHEVEHAEQSDEKISRNLSDQRNTEGSDGGTKSGNGQVRSANPSKV